MSEFVLEVENLNYVYIDGYKALSNISFQVERGSKVFFHGSNGAGKTTLFQCLNGLLKVTDGVIKLYGDVIKKEKERMKSIGMVFQNPNDQIIAGSVFDEIAFGPLNMGLSDEEVIYRTKQAMKVMDIEDLCDKPPHFLSYGQKKRVAIASILSMNQKIIILDEPTAGLDVKQAEELISILNNLSKEGITLLISTHDIEFSFKCANKIVVLDYGEILCEGDTEEVLLLEYEKFSTVCIKKPIIIEIYKELLKNKIIDVTAEIPKDTYKLVELIKRSIK